MATLSLCMIVKDEEAFLQNCLDSVKSIVDEIIIVDNGSKDSTREIAIKAGAKVIDSGITGDFSALRNISLENAKSNWILVLDADEMLDADGRKEVSRLIGSREHCLKDMIGFKFDQRTYKPKKDFEPKITTDFSELRRLYDGHESSQLVRLFRNHPKIRFRNKVHELVEPSIRENKGEIVDSLITIHHFSALKGAGVYREKLGKYAGLIWQQLENEPKNPRYNHQAALAFIDAGRKELGMKYFLRVLKLDQKYPDILSDIAKLHLEMGNVDDAIHFFNAAILRNKNDTLALNNLAVLYMNKGKFDVAQKLLEKALEKDPNNKCLLNNYEKAKKKKR